MLRWIEGVDYEYQGDKVKCLWCGRTLKGPAGLGPHLSSCPERKAKQGGETPSGKGEIGENEALPEEHDALVQVLKDHGVKRRKAIADLMSYRSWDDFGALQEYLELSGVRADRQKLILEGWSQHRGSRLPRGLLESIRPVIGHSRPAEGVLTEEKLLKILDKREEKKRKEGQLAVLQRRLDRLEKGNPGRSEIQELKEELRKSRQDEILTRLGNVERNITSTNNPTVQAIKSMENVLVGVKTDIQSFTRPFAWYLATGRVPDVYVGGKPVRKEVEEGARKGIFKRLPKEYIAEE